MSKFISIIALIFIVATARAAGAQEFFADPHDAVFQKPPNARTAHDLALVMDLHAQNGPETIADGLAKFALKPTKQNFVQIGESASQAIQNGGSSLSSASTSLVAKAVSSILGVAEEAGAVSSSSSGSATTITANIPQFFHPSDLSGHRCYVISDSCSFGGQLVRGMSASVSFNTSASTTPNGTNLSQAALAGITGTQTPVFSGFTFQENFLGRKKHVTQSDFQKALEKISSTQKTDLLSSYNAIQAAFMASSEYQTRLSSCVTSLQQPDAVDAKLDQLLKACVDSYVALAAAVTNINTLLATYQQKNVAYDIARDSALTTLFYASTLSVDYNLTDNLNQPTQSTIKGVYGYQATPAFQATANASVTLYNSLEGSSQSRLRSAQAAVQMDYKPNTTHTLQSAFSAGYYFQYMKADGLINLPSTAFAPNTTIPLPTNASVLLNTTGPIHIGQGKVTLSLKNSNISIPLGITGASRTDLIKATKVSGNFGISYDFSSLFSGK